VGSGSGRKSPETIGDLIAWLAAAPQGTIVPAAALHDLLASLANGGPHPPPEPAASATFTWRERLWTAPADTRLGVREVAEAIGRPKGWVYRRTSAKSGKAPLPHRKLDGELVFVAGELRTWLRRHEVPGAGLVGIAGGVA
jgi:hypothetical protein